MYLVTSEGFEIVSVTDGPQDVWDYADYALRFVARSNPAVDHSSYSISVSLEDNPQHLRPMPSDRSFSKGNTSLVLLHRKFDKFE